MMLERHASFKYKFENRHFLCGRYYVDFMGKCEGDRRIHKKLITGGFRI